MQDNKNLSDKDNEANEARLQESSKYLRRAYHLANFGTLTSLISTGAYYVEQTFVKKLHPKVVKATIAAIGVGIVSVVASYYYNLKAGKVVLDNEEAMSRQRRDTVKSIADATAMPEVAAKTELETSKRNWTDKQAETAQAAELAR